MAHGLPDYGIAAPKVTVAGLEDMAELAARLGSPNTFERKGDVLWMDDFNDGIHKWVVELTEDRGTVTWEGNHSRNGGFCVKLTTGDTFEDLVRILRRMPIAVVSKMGLEVSFVTHGLLGDVYFEMLLYDGTYAHNVAVYWRRADSQWIYTDADGNEAPLLPLMKLTETDYTFHTMKLVADFTTHYFQYLIVDNTIFDMSTIPYKYGLDDTAPCFIIYIHCTNHSEDEVTVYVDDVIVTQNEP